MHTVRLVVLEISVLLFVLILCWIRGGRENVIFSGKVKNLDSGVVLLYHEDGITVDTLGLNKKGEFVYEPLL